MPGGKRACTGLAGSVEAEHEKAHFFRSEDLAHDLGNLAAHDGDSERKLLESVKFVAASG